MDPLATGSGDMTTFVAGNALGGDVAQSNTAGLYHLTDYKRKRLEALEEKEQKVRETLELSPSSRSTTPGTPQPRLKKRKREAAKSKLSFGVDDGEDEDQPASSVPASSNLTDNDPSPASTKTSQDVHSKKRVGPNSSIGVAPKVLTKSAITKDSELRERLRKEFLLKQEAVKSTDILVPFVFYDGTNIPGGVCKMKKGDAIWLFLDRSRKVGANLGVGGADKSKREWARVGVDDLMLVQEDIIIPHHFDFYHFISNAVQGFHGTLFNYSADVPSTENMETTMARKTEQRLSTSDAEKEIKLEGAEFNATQTKVVDRRWYEKHKHIYPSSIWEEYDPNKDYTKGIRKDPKGNTFFFR